MSRKDREVDAELEKLPLGLNSTYDRVLQRISGQRDSQKKLALRCFAWVLYAKRPLSPKELQHAAAVTLKGADYNVFEDLLADMDDIGFMLESVQEFFSGTLSYTQSQVFGDSFDAASLHAELSKGFLAYLVLGLRDLKPCNTYSDLLHRTHLLSLGPYASQSFDHHIKSSCQTLPEILRLATDFLDLDSDFLGAILQMRISGEKYCQLRNFTSMDFEVTGATITYSSHLYDIRKLRLEYTGKHTTPYVMHQATIAGSRAVVEELLNIGQGVNTEDTQGVTPLYYAASYGHQQIVKLLLDSGANANVLGGRFGTPIQAAASAGYRTIVQVLLDNGADINARGGEFGSALQAASWTGDEEIFRLLLEQGADVNTQGGKYGNAIQAACWVGEAKVVQILLDMGAEVNMQGGQYGNALQAASWVGGDDVVQMLLEKGADIDAQGGKYGNALQAACWAGEYKVVQILLDKGANVNAPRGSYGNALEAALGGGRVLEGHHDRVMQILLDSGACGKGQYLEYCGFIRLPRAAELVL